MTPRSRSTEVVSLLLALGLAVGLALAGSVGAAEDRAPGRPAMDAPAWTTEGTWGEAGDEDHGAWKVEVRFHGDGSWAATGSWWAEGTGTPSVGKTGPWGPSPPTTPPEGDEASGQKKGEPGGGKGKKDAASCPRHATRDGSARIALAFDDGYRSAYAASRVMETHGMCGSFFIISDFLREGPWYTNFVSAAEVRAMSARGHLIGSHTMTHPDLTTLSSRELTTELVGSRLALEELTGRTVEHFAYPYGVKDAAVEDATASLYLTGRMYASDLAAYEAAPRRPHDMPALGIEADTTQAQARAYVDWARAHDLSLILVFHDLDGSGPLAWPMAEFASLVGYIAGSDVDTRTVAELYAAGQLPG